MIGSGEGNKQRKQAMYAVIIEVGNGIWAVNINANNHVELQHSIVSSFLEANDIAKSFGITRIEVNLL
jgi:hypothetical protein